MGALAKPPAAAGFPPCCSISPLFYHAFISILFYFLLSPHLCSQKGAWEPITRCGPSPPCPSPSFSPFPSLCSWSPTCPHPSIPAVSPVLPVGALHWARKGLTEGDGFQPFDDGTGGGSISFCSPSPLEASTASGSLGHLFAPHPWGAAGISGQPSPFGADAARSPSAGRAVANKALSLRVPASSPLFVEVSHPSLYGGGGGTPPKDPHPAPGEYENPPQNKNLSLSIWQPAVACSTLGGCLRILTSRRVRTARGFLFN